MSSLEHFRFLRGGKLLFGGLFHKAIVASGSALMSRAVKTSERMDEYSRNMARLLGATEDEIKDPMQRIQFLRDADPQMMTERIFMTADREVITTLWSTFTDKSEMRSPMRDLPQSPFK